MHELEKKAEDVKNNTDDDAKEKKVESRLVALEQAQKKSAADQEPPQQESISHAKAPFVVYDDDDHPIFRVELSPKTKAPRVTVGNPLGAHAVLAASDADKLAGLLLFAGQDASKAQVALFGEKQSYLVLTSAETRQQMLLGTAPDGRYGLFISKNDVGSVALTSTDDGAGYLGLANKAGEFVVEAASKPNGVGIVRTGPKCCPPPGAVGPHAYIVGTQ